MRSCDSTIFSVSSICSTVVSLALLPFSLVALREVFEEFSFARICEASW